MKLKEQAGAFNGELMNGDRTNKLGLVFENNVFHDVQLALHAVHISQTSWKHSTPIQSPKRFLPPSSPSPKPHSQQIQTSALFLNLQSRRQRQYSRPVIVGPLARHMFNLIVLELRVSFWQNEDVERNGRSDEKLLICNTLQSQF